jgi:hypothetical protein
VVEVGASQSSTSGPTGEAAIARSHIHAPTDPQTSSSPNTAAGSAPPGSATGSSVPRQQQACAIPAGNQRR